MALPEAEGGLRCSRAAGTSSHTGAGSVCGSRTHRLLPARTRTHTEGPAQSSQGDTEEQENHAASIRYTNHFSLKAVLL